MNIQKLSFNLACSLTKELGKEESQPLIYYGLQILIGALLKGTVLVCFSLLFNIFYETLFVVLGAVFLRILSGGPHCTSYERCLISTLVIFLPLGYLSKKLAILLPTEILMELLSIAFLIAIVLIFKWAPGEHQERVFTKLKKYCSKILSSFLILIVFLVCFYASEGQLLFIFYPVFVGLLWQTVSITPLGYGFIAILDKALVKLFEEEVVT